MSNLSNKCIQIYIKLKANKYLPKLSVTNWIWTLVAFHQLTCLVNCPSERQWFSNTLQNQLQSTTCAKFMVMSTYFVRNFIRKLITQYFLTKLIRAQQPALSVLWTLFLIYLKYTCSRLHNPAARRTPHINKKKADKNCSGASGSLDLFSSFFGLQVPVNQNLLSLSRSPV